MSQTRMSLHCAEAKARPSGSHSGSRGFTLIELMVTIAIIAILAAIAIPNYSDYVRRGKIAEATSTLSDMRTKMEQYFQDNRTYVGACSVPPAVTIAPKPTGKYFQYDCLANGGPSATGYTVTATGIASLGMGGFTYTIDQNNARNTLTLPAGWTNTSNCWVLKKDGSC